MNFSVFLNRILAIVLMLLMAPAISANASSNKYYFKLENWNEGGKQTLGQQQPYPFTQSVNLIMETDGFLPDKEMKFSFGLNGALNERYSTGYRILNSPVAGTLSIFNIFFRCSSNQLISGSRFYVINVAQNTNVVDPSSIKNLKDTLDRQLSSAFTKRAIEYVQADNPYVDNWEKRVNSQIKVPKSCTSLGAKIEANVFALKKDENNSVSVTVEITRPAAEGEYFGVNTNELQVSAGKVVGLKGNNSAYQQLKLDLGSSRVKIGELDLERKKIFDTLTLDPRFTSCKVSTSTELGQLNTVKSESKIKFGQISLFYPEIFEAWSKLLDRTIAYAEKGYSRGCSGADFMDGQDKLLRSINSSNLFGPDGKASAILLEVAKVLSAEKSVSKSEIDIALEFFANLQSLQTIVTSPAVTPAEQSFGRTATKDLRVAQVIAKKFTFKTAKNFNAKAAGRYSDKACVLDKRFIESDFGVFSNSEKDNYLKNLCNFQRFKTTRAKILMDYFN